MMILLAIIAVLLAVIAVALVFGKSAAQNTLTALGICVTMTLWLVVS